MITGVVLSFNKKTIYLTFCTILLISAYILSGCSPGNINHPGTTQTSAHTSPGPVKSAVGRFEESDKSSESEQPKAETIPLMTEINFGTLQTLNPDIYAWIEIPGTVISYPILQYAGDNAYYLKHSPDGSYSAAGAIFTEDYNSKDFSDRNTVIYGHYMEDGTQFAELHSFMDESFLTENRYIYIHTPNKTLNYKIFAVYPYDTRHLLLSFDYSNPYVFGKVFDKVFAIRDMSARIVHDTSLDGENDLVITLSTCYYGDEQQRLLLQAVLLE